MYTPPLKFPTPEILKKAIDKYFNQTPIDEITQTGLLLSIGLAKSNFNVYHKREGYREIVSIAKLRIENSYEVALRKDGGAHNIFALKNFGWIAEERRVLAGDENSPLVTKIVREIVNVSSVTQIEHQPIDATDDFTADHGLDDDDDDFLS